jgi:hypothetical protein
LHFIKRAQELGFSLNDIGVVATSNRKPPLRICDNYAFRIRSRSK